MKTLVLLLLGAIVAQAQGDERSPVYTCRAYSLDMYTGTYHDFTEAVPYLASYSFDNTIESARVTGVWIFYEYPEYNTYDTGLVHYTWGLDALDPITDSINNRISSLRYAGSQLMMNQDGFNVYAGTYFTGKDLYESSNIPDMFDYYQSVSSIIIIGTAPWTFCDQPYYSGHCVCLSANQYDQSGGLRLDVGFYPTIQQDPSIGLSQVMSVLKYC